MKKTRRLKDGLAVTIHSNQGLRKRCRCTRRSWSSCPHPWAFSFKWKADHHRFPIDKHATGPIITKDDARDEADRLRAENTKTSTMRQLPISPRLLAVLKLLRLDPAGNELPATGFVFGDAIGGEMGFQKKAWAKALKAAGIQNLEFRDLRHEGAVGWQIAAGPFPTSRRCSAMRTPRPRAST